MAFDGLGDKLQDIFKRMKGQGKISEKDLKAVMREVKHNVLKGIHAPVSQIISVKDKYALAPEHLVSC